MPPFFRLLPVALVLFNSPSFADILASKAWVRGTVAGQSATGAYMTLRSTEDCIMIEARSPIAGRVEIHTMSREDGMMKMRSLPGLELPAGKTVELAPRGNHIMLMELNKPLNKGDRVPITLVSKCLDRKVETLQVNAEVQSLSGN